MNLLKLDIWFLIITLLLGSASFLMPHNAYAARAEKRTELRQDRRGDRQENTAKGSQNRQDFRGQRRDCTGNGSDCRSDNRQNKRQERQDITGDRQKDRGGSGLINAFKRLNSKGMAEYLLKTREKALFLIAFILYLMALTQRVGTRQTEFPLFTIR